MLDKSRYIGYYSGSVHLMLKAYHGKMGITTYHEFYYYGILDEHFNFTGMTFNSNVNNIFFNNNVSKHFASPLKISYEDLPLKFREYIESNIWLLDMAARNPADQTAIKI